MDLLEASVGFRLPPQPPQVKFSGGLPPHLAYLYLQPQYERQFALKPMSVATSPYSYLVELPFMHAPSLHVPEHTDR